MNKIGLCIVYHNYNYGSMLQSYATIIRLQEMGYDYEIICYKPKRDIWFVIKSIPRLFNYTLMQGKIKELKRKSYKKNHKEFRELDRIRADAFDSFSNAYFNQKSNVITDYHKLTEYSKTFSTVIVGSDQLWLPSGLATNFYNLMFVPDEINKVAFAASFGVSSIPWYQKKRTKKYLNRLNYISVREDSAKCIVETISDKKAVLVADPTISIKRDKWEELIKYQKMSEEPYIFCYFLGNNPESRQAVLELKEKLKIKVIMIRHLDEYFPNDENIGDFAPYDMTPFDFVNYIRGATVVCTDSFHGTVFSILNHKNFITFKRFNDKGKNSRNSRLYSLFNHLKIDRFYDGNAVQMISNKIDYEIVDKNLDLLRVRTDEYLLEAVK